MSQLLASPYLYLAEMQQSIGDEKRERRGEEMR
jgi:hypothetical protein